MSNFTVSTVNPTYQQECALYNRSIKDEYDPEFITYLQNSNEKIVLIDGKLILEEKIYHVIVKINIY